MYANKANRKAATVSVPSIMNSSFLCAFHTCLVLMFMLLHKCNRWLATSLSKRRMITSLTKASGTYLHGRDNRGGKDQGKGVIGYSFGLLGFTSDTHQRKPANGRLRMCLKSISKPAAPLQNDTSRDSCGFYGGRCCVSFKHSRALLPVYLLQLTVHVKDAH